MMTSRLNNVHRYTKGKLVKVKLGICAMDKKARSKPMREILARLPESLFEIKIFGDEVILNDPVEDWPQVEILIAFYSTNFPTEKALEYVKLRDPFMINDLEMEATLKDRRRVYELLQANGIHVPVHVYCERDSGEDDKNTVEEFDEYIVVNGVQINKPLVEKPVDAENHNIYIYYPMSAGGGSKRLFRKINDRSSEFYPNDNELRREGSFIYEEFIVTQGTDVKVYTVGPDYGHAEARKSPVVDGKVNRDPAGLEMRYPVILSPVEKEMARKIVLAFRQTVCGFDILRVHGRSYCCDVNGFSFVKSSRKYYDDASQVLCEFMLTQMRPDIHSAISTRAPILRRHTLKKNANTAAVSKLTAENLHNTEISRGRSKRGYMVNKDSGHDTHTPTDEQSNLSDNDSSTNVRAPSPSTGEVCRESFSATSLSRRNSNAALGEKEFSDDGDKEELRCVIAVTRHADRTPKQKMKLKVSLPEYLDFFHSYIKSPKKDLKVKSKSALVRFLNITQKIVDSGELEDDVDLHGKLQLIRDVLERWEISGINRKLQMKPMKWEGDDESDDESKGKSARDSTTSAKNVGSKYDYSKKQPKKTTDTGGLAHQAEAKTAPQIADAQISPDSSNNQEPKATEVLVIFKWGGDLTPLGREQAEQMGALFRKKMYPDNAGGGVLRLHATYRHDLKIKASDEGRVMKTAAAFAKGLLELEGQLTPILASLVTIEEKNRQMLDHGGNKAVKEDLDRCKDHLNLIQEEGVVLDDAFINEFAMGCPDNLRKTIESMDSPLKYLRRLHELIEKLCSQLREICKEEEAEGGSSFEKKYMENAHNLDRHERTASEDLSKKLYIGETYSLMLDRWEKLNKDFFNKKTGIYDLSKVPDVYDMIRYDILHNPNCPVDGTEELYSKARVLENTCVPLEYGKDPLQKSVIGSKVCGALLEKIKYDLRVSRSDTTQDMRFLLDHSHADDLAINSLGRVVRTRLYFTSESHMHTLLNVLSYGGDSSRELGLTGADEASKTTYPNAISPEGRSELDKVAELAYCAQLCIRLFEQRGEVPEGQSRFRCEISFTPGATNDIFVDKGSSLAPFITLNQDISCERLLTCLTKGISIGKEITPEEADAVRETLRQDEEEVDVKDEVHAVHLTDQPYTQGGEDSPAAKSRNMMSGLHDRATYGSNKFPIQEKMLMGDKEEEVSYQSGSVSNNTIKSKERNGSDMSDITFVSARGDAPSPVIEKPPWQTPRATDLSISAPAFARVESLASIGELTPEGSEDGDDEGDVTLHGDDSLFMEEIDCDPKDIIVDSEDIINNGKHVS